MHTMNNNNYSNGKIFAMLFILDFDEVLIYSLSLTVVIKLSSFFGPSFYRQARASRRAYAKGPPVSQTR